MEIEYFKKADNTEFAIVNTHGGTYISYDNLVTVSNQSLFSHHATEYYDVLTDTFNRNRIFVGTQDQGLQRTLTGATAGIQNFQQVISGDYGQMALSGNNQFLWPQYPGGTFYLYTNLGDAVSPSYIGQWTMGGSQKSNYGWMLPVAGTPNASANEIWMGGGNITGGGGSYLVKLSMLTSSPYTVTPVQNPYNFRAASNSGNAGITAIEQSLVNPDKMYVALEDGSFFYSDNLGATWNKTTSFTGPTPWYLYGSCILASRKKSNIVWYTGSGYNNPPVYKSVDGGASFTAMSTGLPPTLVNEIVATPNEDLLFAATEAGPYVYVTAANQWFPLISNSMPIQFFSGVEYISAADIVRFSTMGRGIWDFNITSAGALPVNVTRFEAVYQRGKSFVTWRTSSESNSSHYTVQRSLDGLQFTDVGTLPAARNSTTLRTYNFIDDLSFLSGQSVTVYYRLQQADLNGITKTTAVVKIKTKGEATILTLLYNPVKTEAVLNYKSELNEAMVIRVFDALGKTVYNQTLKAMAGSNQVRINTSSLAEGTYIIELNNGRERSTAKMFKE
jgi:hypothetical protein